MCFVGRAASPKATINIYSDEDEYLPGETVEVSFDITVPAALRHNGIKVKCYIQHQVVCNRGIWGRFSQRTDPFLEVKEVEPVGELTPGVHQYTLRWPLKADFPSSIFYASRYSAVLLCYRIKVEIALPGLFKSNIEALARITVYARVPPSAPVMAAHTFPVSTCCTHAGSLSLYGALSKDHYLAGEEVVVNIALNATDLSIPVKRVVVSLKRQEILRKNPLQRGVKSTSVVSRQNFPGLAAGAKEERRAVLPIPLSSQPSVETAILSHSYYIQVVAVFGMCAKEKFKMNLEIAAPFGLVRWLTAAADETESSEASDDEGESEDAQG